MPQWMPKNGPEVPPHAVPIWYADGKVWIGLDGTSVALPSLEATVKRRGEPVSAFALGLSECLRNRALRVDRIGTPSHPTQAQVPDLAKSVQDAWLAQDRAAKAEAKAAAEAEAKAKLIAEFDELFA